MKQITKVGDLVSGAVYWVRLKDSDRAAIESVICAINRSRHYFVFSNDIDVNKDINHHDAHSVLNNHIVVGPVPTPTIWEFMKYTVEMKADPNQGLCQEISLPSEQTCVLKEPDKNQLTQILTNAKEIHRLVHPQKVEPNESDKQDS